MGFVRVDPVALGAVLSNQAADADTDWMEGLESDFRREFQIPSSDWRSSYKIFYSRVHQHPVLFLGRNPAGDPSGGNLDASGSYYQGWEHDFVKYRDYGARYRLARPAYDTLAACLGTNSADQICKVPTSNVCFWCSVNLPKDRTRFREHVTYLKRLVERVHPELIVLCGAGEGLPILKAAIDLNINKMGPPITGPWGRADAELYRLLEASWEGGRIKLMALAHLSRLGPRGEFREQVLPAIRRDAN